MNNKHPGNAEPDRFIHKTIKMKQLQAEDLAFVESCKTIGQVLDMQIDFRLEMGEFFYVEGVKRTRVARLVARSARPCILPRVVFQVITALFFCFGLLKRIKNDVEVGEDIENRSSLQTVEKLLWLDF